MKKAYILAGHNGKGTGAVGFIDEGAETIVLRDCLVDWLQIKYPELQVITDRGRDNLTLAGGILKWLKSIVKQNDITVDIHFNSSSNETATGVEVLIPSKYSQFEFNFAKDILKAITDNLGLRNRGVKTEDSGAHGSLAMLSGIEGENILIEVCFCSNKTDCIAYTDYKPELIAALGNIIFKYCSK